MHGKYNFGILMWSTFVLKLHAVPCLDCVFWLKKCIIGYTAIYTIM